MTTVTFGDGVLHQAAWICYINGLEIPVMAAEVQFGVWRMPVASLQFTPHPLLQRIGSEDRLQVIIFYLDEFIEPKNPQFRLLGEFEAVGSGYSSTTGSRQFQLDCVAPIQIFKQMYFSQLAAYKNAIVKKAVDGLAIFGSTLTVQTGQDWPSDPLFTSFTGMVNSKKKSPTNRIRKGSFIRRPIDLILHIFQAILSPVNTAKVETKTSDSSATKNDFPTQYEKASVKSPPGKVTRATSVISKNFYARWMKMTGFHKRFFALPMFEDDITEGGCFPIIKATGGYAALRSLQKHAGPRKGSAWDMFMNIYPKMYMEIAMIPTPPAAFIQKKTGKVIGKTKTAANQFRGIMAYFVKPQCLFAIPPACNILFPSMLESFNYQESYLAQPTRIKIRKGHGSNLAKQLSAGTNSVFRSVVRQLLNTGYPSVVYKRAAAYEKAPGSNDENFLIFPEEMFKGPVIQRMAPPPWMQHLFKRISGKKKDKTGEDDNKFPEMTKEDYIANGLKKAEAEIEDYAKTGEIDQFSEETNAAIQETIGDVVIDPVALEEGKQLVLDRLETSAALKYDEEELTETSGIQSLLKKYAQYEFLRARYEKRGGGVSGHPNPYLTPGFPGVVLDQRASGFDCYGYVTNVTQSYSVVGTSAQWKTRADLAFMRTIQEDDRDKVREPISSVRKILQSKTNVTEFYKSLFFAKEEPNKPTAFIREDVLEDVDIKYRLVGPTAAFRDAFEHYDTAMRFVARPGCTLIEYIEAYHDATFTDLLAAGTIQGEHRSFYSASKDATPKAERGGAIYWSRIYKLKQGAGPNPGSKVTNIGTDANESPVEEFTPVDNTHGDMSQTRYDWDTALELYRNLLYGTKGYAGPQE